MLMSVVAVAAGIAVIPGATVWSVGQSGHSASSHFLWSCHLLLRCCHGDDGNYREADLDTVCQLISVICFVAVEYDLCVVVVIQEVWLSHMIRVMFRN